LRRLREWNRDFEIFVQGLCSHIQGEQSQGMYHQR
jgi:hypothetical protein